MAVRKVRLMSRGVSHVPQFALDEALADVRARAGRLAASAGDGSRLRFSGWSEQVETLPDRLSHDLLTVVTVAVDVSVESFKESSSEVDDAGAAVLEKEHLRSFADSRFRV